jgi:hypothetical protein
MNKQKTPVEYDLEKYEHELDMLLMLLNGGGDLRVNLLLMIGIAHKKIGECKHVIEKMGEEIADPEPSDEEREEILKDCIVITVD